VPGREKADLRDDWYNNGVREHYGHVGAEHESANKLGLDTLKKTVFKRGYMRLTNKYHLDRWLVDLLTDSIQQPDPDVMRVTELIDAPLIKTLRLKHWDDITIDVSEFLQPMYGNAVHDFLSRHVTGVNIDSEQEVSATFLDGTVVRGHFDMMEDGILRDFKTTKVGYLKIADNVEKWTQQLNVYAYLISTYSIKVSRLEIHIPFRNWAKQRAKFTHNYPKIPYEKLELELWDSEKQRNFIEERIRHHLNNPLVCTDKNRWKQKTTYAVKKKGGKRALQVLHSMDEAEQWMEETGRGKYIEVRQGGYIRCEDFCELKEFCPYYTKSC